MLAYILGLVVGIGSLIILVKTVLAKERQTEDNFFRTDIFWSGVGLFYGLVLWVCAERITGALLLGQIASVVLIAWLVWQVKDMRLATNEASSPTNSSFIADLFGKQEQSTELTLTEVADELEKTVEDLELSEAGRETETENIVGEKEASVTTEEAQEQEQVGSPTQELEEKVPTNTDVEISPTTEEIVTSEDLDKFIPQASELPRKMEDEMETEIEVSASVSETVITQEPEVKLEANEANEMEETSTKETEEKT